MHSEHVSGNAAYAGFQDNLIEPSLPAMGARAQPNVPLRRLYAVG